MFINVGYVNSNTSLISNGAVAIFFMPHMIIFLSVTSSGCTKILLVFSYSGLFFLAVLKLV